jgi:hypothetical protein
LSTKALGWSSRSRKTLPVRLLRSVSSRRPGAGARHMFRGAIPIC